MHDGAIGGVGNDYIEPEFVGQTGLVEVLLHGEGSAEQADAVISGGCDGFACRIRDVEQGDAGSGGDRIGHPVHGVGADDNEVGAAAFEPLRGLDHLDGQRAPVAGVLETFDVAEIDRVHQAAGGMHAAETFAHLLIDDAVILGRAFPAHAADQADCPGLHGARRVRDHVGRTIEGAKGTIKSNRGPGCKTKAAVAALVELIGAGGPALFRLWHDPDIGLRRLPSLRVDRLGFVVADGAGDDDVLALFPVRGRGDTVLGRELQRVDHPDDLIEIAAGGHRVGQRQLDLLVRADDEYGAHGGVVGRGAVGGVAGRIRRQHVVEFRDLEIGVADHGVVRGRTLGLADVFRPQRMPGHRIDAQSDQLDAAFVELSFQPGEGAKLGGAHRGEVLGMRKQQCPATADPVVKPDGAVGGFSLEIRRGCADLQCHVRLLLYGPNLRTWYKPRARCAERFREKDKILIGLRQFGSIGPLLWLR